MFNISTIRAARRSAPVALVPLVLALGMAGCGTSAPADTATGPSAAPATAAPAVQSGGRLRYCIESDTSGFHPYLDRWSTAGLVMANAVYDPLAAYAADGSVRPYLAKSFTPDATFTRWTIGLREGITFTDGTALDADAVVTHLQRVRDSYLTSAVVRPVTDVKATDPTHVEVTLSEPWSTFPVLLTSQPGMVPSPTSDPATLSSAPIGTGPFQLTAREPERQTVMQRNARYWRAGLPRLDAVEFIPGDATRECPAMLRDGTADAGHASSTAAVADLRAMGDALNLTQDEGEPEELFVMFRTDQPPFDDARLRRALDLGTDRVAFANAVGDDPAQATDRAFADNSPWSASIDKPGYDPIAAKALVAEVSSERGPVRVKITATNDLVNLNRTQELKRQWEQLGVSVELESVDMSNLSPSASPASTKRSCGASSAPPTPTASSSGGIRRSTGRPR